MGKNATDNGTSALGFEATLWAAADKLRGHMDAAEYKHVVLKLIFLKYISDAFEERHAAVMTEYGEEATEDRDEYTAEGTYWVPREARWADLKANAKQPEIGRPAGTGPPPCSAGSAQGGAPPLDALSAGAGERFVAAHAGLCRSTLRTYLKGARAAAQRRGGQVLGWRPDTTRLGAGEPRARLLVPEGGRRGRGR